MKELEEKEKQRQQSEASVQRNRRHLNRGLERGVVIAQGSFTWKYKGEVGDKDTRGKVGDGDTWGKVGDGDTRGKVGERMKNSGLEILGEAEFP